MSSDDTDQIKEDYEKMRKEFAEQSAAERESGGWLFKLIHWMLNNYSKTVDAAYIKRKYPGAGPTNQSKKAISLASRYAAVVGGTSAAAVTGLQVATIGTAGISSAITIPTIGGAILADAAMTTRIQLRSAYDLSVIHGAPLSMDDAEDCMFLLMAALGVKSFEVIGDFARTIGPGILVFNVRRLLRTGLRRAVTEFVAKVAGTQAARKITERVALRVLVPGIGIPISAGMNYAFTKGFLKITNRHMIRRGAVFQPLLRLFKEDHELPRILAVKALITVMEAPARKDGGTGGWGEWQLSALRQTQNLLMLTDDEVGALDEYWERSAEEIHGEISGVKPAATAALRDYLITAAALGRREDDEVYGQAIQKICANAPEFEPDAIATVRKRLAG